MKCPTFERLIDFLDARLDSSAAAEVAEHLESGCGSCGADRDWYFSLKSLVTSDDSVEPPVWVFKRALRVFEETGRSRTTVASRAGRLIASLLFDSANQPAMGEARSAVSDGRQLLYRAGDYSVDLQIMPVDRDQWDITGQILREGEFLFESVAGLRLQLSSAAGAYSNVTSDRGEFGFRGLKPGTYDLRFEVRGARVTIKGLRVS